MKPFHYLLCIIAFHSIVTCIFGDNNEEPLWRREQLTAVTSFAGIEDLFMELHGRKMDAENPQREDSFRTDGVNKLDLLEDNLDIKRRMCKNILSTFHFESENKYSVDPEQKTIRSQLKRDQESIHGDLFKRTKREKRFPGDKSFKNVFRNPFKERKLTIVSYGRDMNVFMFSCLVRKRENKNFEQYFISEEYNMSPASYKSPLARAIAGRFIFGPNEKNALEIKAVAQEAVKSFQWINNLFIEFSYLDKKLSYPTPETPDADSICKLSSSQRLRLCVSCFSISFFKGKYKFESSLDIVKGPCEKRPVSFRNKVIQQEAGKKVFEEFMISCKPTLVDMKENIDNIIFYISQAYVHDKAFLFRQREEEIFLEHYVYGTGLSELNTGKNP